MDTKEQRPKYTTPIVIQLGQIPTGAGKNLCGNGQVAKVTCSVGSTVGS